MALAIVLMENNDDRVLCSEFPYTFFWFRSLFCGVLMKEQIKRNEKSAGDYSCISPRISLVNHQDWAWIFANKTLTCALALFGGQVSQISMRWLFSNSGLHDLALAYRCKAV